MDGIAETEVRPKIQEGQPQGNETEEILMKYDPEYSMRRLKGPLGWATFAIAVGWSCFQLYTAALGVFPPTLQRAPHVGLALILTFLLAPARKKNRDRPVPWYDFVLAVLSAIVCSYHIVYYEPLIFRAGAFTTTDAVVSVIAVLLVLEATRRLAGPVMVTLASLFLLYAYFGRAMPGFLRHPGFDIERIFTHSWLSTEGILGVPIQVSSTFIFLFLLFAAFLRRTGLGDWLTSLAVGLTGASAGGPAKAAVVASACFGTVSGSSVANTVGTGSVTIPLMKSIGYRPEFAGAVEAAASTGGQLMPPIMGAAAFIMSEFTGIPYFRIALAAAIPAILYFAGIFIMVHLEALRTGLKGLPRDRLPNWKHLLKTRWFLITPVVVIVYLLVTGYTPMLAALAGLVACIAVTLPLRDNRLSLRDIVECLYEGARSALPVVAACATAGIIIGIVTLTGLGLKMAYGIIALARGNVYLTMCFTMFTSLILGMGVPTTANYVITSTIAAPALLKLGIPVIAAHLFVFYFGIIADITPPVALAAFAGAGIARSNPFRTGFEAFRLGFAAYLVPHIFALSPALVLVGITPLGLIKALLTALIGMTALAGGLTGYLLGDLGPVKRAMLLVAGVMLIDPGTLTDLLGGVVLLAVLALQRRRQPGVPEVRSAG